jgi:hypothetical protein
MTAEQRLREILRSEATTIVPAADGLAKIRERIERRRRLRIWFVPSAVLATAAAVTAFFLFSPDNGRHTQTLRPGGTPSATVTAEPTPLPGDDGGMPLDVPAIWPFTTQVEAAAWQSTRPYADNGLEVGRHFVSDYLGLTGVNVSQSCVSCGVLGLDVNGKPVGQITLATVGVGFASGHGTHVFSVVGVGGTDLTVTSPKAGAAISSPATVTGRVTGVDESVLLRLLTAGGDELATTSAPAGSAVPWSGTLTWSRTDWVQGAIVGITTSLKDGSLTRVVAVPVTRGTAAPATSFAGLVDGHVSLFDGSSGAVLKQLTYPPSGTSDTAASWSAGTLAWIRTGGASACVYEVDRLQNGTASTATKSTTARITSLSLSSDTTALAWVEEPCNATEGRIVVQVAGSPQRVVSFQAQRGRVLDVRDDGTLLVATSNPAVSGESLWIVPPTADTVSGPAPSPASGCESSSAAGFAGEEVVVFESCSGDVRLVHYTITGVRKSDESPVKGQEPPQSLSVRDGKVLVWLFGGDTYGAIARYESGTFRTLIDNNGCTSISTPKGCVASPDW